MTISVNANEAPNHILQWLMQVQQGEDMIITREGKPLAKLSAISDKPFERRLGGGKGTVLAMAGDFDEYQ